VKFLKRWLMKKKAALVLKWAGQLGLHVVKIHVAAGTEYLRMADGSLRKLARAK
jgi:hypothetical protein